MIRKALSFIARLSAFGLAVYVAAVAGLAVAQRVFIYHGDSFRPNRDSYGAAAYEEVTFQTADELTLFSWFAPPTQADAPVIAFFHGNSGHVGNVVRAMEPYRIAGYGVFLLEYRGFGGNPGAPNEEGILNDARAALDVLAARGYVGGDLILMGQSLGTGVAVAMASERDARATILHSPYTSVAEAAQWRFPWTPARYVVLDRWNSQARIATVDEPILILHGDLDRTIPVEMGRALAKTVGPRARYVEVEGGGHNDLFARGAAEIGLRFLANLDVGATH